MQPRSRAAEPAHCEQHHAPPRRAASALGARAGVYLSKDLMSIAGHALKANITTLGPLVLPVSEQLLFFISLVMRKARAPAAPLPP